MLTLTSVSTGKFAQITLSVRIQLETLLVSVKTVSMEITAKISMSASKVVHVMRMQLALTQRGATCVPVTQGTAEMVKLVK